MLGRLATTPTDDYLLLLDVIAAMLDDRSLLKVAQVEEKCGVGTRSLQRLFERYVGVSPKWVLSRYRMHDVVTDLDAGYGGSLADLAAKYGWFDQAHFTREFTDLVGVPPGAYQRQDGKLVAACVVGLGQRRSFRPARRAQSPTASRPRRTRFASGWSTTCSSFPS